MFGIGVPELMLILALALIFIGPKKLPDLARSLGKAMGEFKKATSELKDSIEIENELSNVKKAFSDLSDSERPVVNVPSEEAETTMKPSEKEVKTDQFAAKPKNNDSNTAPGDEDAEPPPEYGLDEGKQLLDSEPNNVEISPSINDASADTEKESPDAERKR